ncbi:hypothetical protein DL96DRAFT_487652 [Flagelloscypha sp. PMI_526]|nr:hypothetical protein DL96DRAFT_487652 [Flagelloscypha sp. PMI_526]
MDLMTKLWNKAWSLGEVHLWLESLAKLYFILFSLCSLCSKSPASIPQIMYFCSLIFSTVHNAFLFQVSSSTPLYLQLWSIRSLASHKGPG